MAVRKKSVATWAVLRASRGGGLVAVANPHRCSGETPARRNRILEGPSAHAELRLELDGECTRTLDGFKAETADRVMLVPYSTKAETAIALAITKAQGLLATKLENMQPEKALDRIPVDAAVGPDRELGSRTSTLTS